MRWNQPSLSLFALLMSLGMLNADSFAEEDPYLRVPESVATTQKEMKPYKQRLRDTTITFEMVPIPGGEFLMGSPASDGYLLKDEAPAHRVRIEPFWMGKHEVTWNEYNTWRDKLDIKFRAEIPRIQDAIDKRADAITRPTKEYADMSYGMGIDGFPAINLTQLGAKMYCAWLSEKTGQYYRLPTEAEWEYACRAGTTTIYSFGDDVKDLGDYAWYYENCGERYHKIGLKKPNPWGLHDMHGNVAEWCLDQYIEDYYGRFKPNHVANSPLAVPTILYPRVVRGGSWFDDPDALRSSKRIPSSPDWKIQDAQLPQSMWYHTDADWVGFRLVRPLKRPTDEEIQKQVLYPDIPKHLIK